MSVRFAVMVLFLGLGGRCMAIETPAYQVEFEAKPFQIRDYPPLLTATVHVSGTRDEAVSSGFRLLAHYIFGGNQTKTKIAMTAPVLQTPAGKPQVTATVASVTGWDVSFIMPSSYTKASLPATPDAAIHFSEVPAHRMAVIAFSGLWTDANLQEHQQQLLDFLAERHLTPDSAPIYAFYNPPWTPWFWRTNEVQYRLAD
jgi:hypothetical protein